MKKTAYEIIEIDFKCFNNCLNILCPCNYVVKLFIEFSIRLVYVIFDINTIEGVEGVCFTRV